MELHLLLDIPFEISKSKLLKKLYIDEGSEDCGRLEELIARVYKIARPKALFGCASIGEICSGHVIVEGIRFDSSILSTNLKGNNRCFPFIATSGQEVENWSKGIDDLAEAYWADAIKQEVLVCAVDYMRETLDKTYSLGKTAMMNPGSLRDWPLGEQKKLFALLGEKVKETGVELTDSCLMVPVKTISGILFETESGFKNCMLCDRPDCPGRHAEYNPELLKTKYNCT